MARSTVVCQIISTYTLTRIEQRQTKVPVSRYRLTERSHFGKLCRHFGRQAFICPSPKPRPARNGSCSDDLNRCQHLGHALLSERESSTVEVILPFWPRGNAIFLLAQLIQVREFVYCFVPKATPGKYSDLENNKSIQLKLDGIQVEWMEKGAVLYFWSEGRYRKIVVSD